MKHLITCLFAIVALFGSCSPSSDTAVPSVPTGIESSSVTENSFIVTWKASSGAKSYDWKLEEGSDEKKSGSRTSPYVQIDGLEAGHSYLFAVRACNGEAVSAWSKSLSVTTSGSSQSDPTSLCVDSPLLLQLNSAPELGAQGFIKVFDSSDNQVDAINLADLETVSVRDDGQMIPKTRMTGTTTLNTFMDVVPCGPYWRVVHYTPLRLRSNALEIKLHSGVLDYGREYYVTMDAGFVKNHAGLAKGDWTFTTKAAPSSASGLNVNSDGSADFCTIQGALIHAASKGRNDNVVINVASGTYNEMPCLREKNNVSIRGANRETTVIAYANSEAYESGSGSSVDVKPTVGQAIDPKNSKNTGGRGVMLFENCDNLSFENLTMRNTFGSRDGQAEVIYFNSGNNTHRLTIENCALYSLQDTFLCKGRVWVHNSLIAGHCDYIWGYPELCLFEDCEIRSEYDGYIVQARTAQTAKGFVFLNCRLTAGEKASNNTVYLARANNHDNETAKTYDNVVFVNCRMSPVIRRTGWLDSPAPLPASPSATSGWREYGSMDLSGNALDLSGRSTFGKVLTAEEAVPYLTREAVMN